VSSIFEGKHRACFSVQFPISHKGYRLCSGEGLARLIRPYWPKNRFLPRSVSSSQGRFVDPVAYPQGSGAFRDGLTEFGLSVAVRVKACWTFIMTTKWVPLRRLSFGDGYAEFCGSISIHNLITRSGISLRPVNAWFDPNPKDGDSSAVGELGDLVSRRPGREAVPDHAPRYLCYQKTEQCWMPLDRGFRSGRFLMEFALLDGSAEFCGIVSTFSLSCSFWRLLLRLSPAVNCQPRHALQRVGGS
jgi:hypothetical protein